MINTLHVFRYHYGKKKWVGHMYRGDEQAVHRRDGTSLIFEAVIDDEIEKYFSTANGRLHAKIPCMVTGFRNAVLSSRIMQDASTTSTSISEMVGGSLESVLLSGVWDFPTRLLKYRPAIQTTHMPRFPMEGQRVRLLERDTLPGYGILKAGGPGAELEGDHGPADVRGH